MIDYHAIWNEVTSRFPPGLSSIHGPEHWHRVEDVGLKMANLTGADRDVLRLFAVLHDSCRLTTMAILSMADAPPSTQQICAAGSSTWTTGGSGNCTARSQGTFTVTHRRM